MDRAPLPSPPPPPPEPEHQDLAVKIRQIQFLHAVAGFKERGMGNDAAIGAAIIAWAETQEKT